MLSAPVLPTVTTESVVAACRALGFDPQTVRSLTIERDAVLAELFLVTERGERCAAGDELAVAKVRLPIEGKLFAAPPPYDDVTA